MDIIIEISCTGTPIFLKPRRPFSIPSVSWLGVVVRVISDEPITRRISLIPIFRAMVRPSFEIFSIPSWNSGSPGVRNKLKLTEMRSRIRMFLSPFVMNLKGTLLSLMSIPSTTAATAYIVQLSTTKRAIRNTSVPSSLTRGSSLWITESTG